MASRRSSPLIRTGLIVVALGFLSVLCYPLVQESFYQAGRHVYRNAQQAMIKQSMADYLRFNPSPGWTANTSTIEILNDLSSGWDRDLDGRPESFLPPSEPAGSLSRRYRIIFKSPQNFRIVARQG